MSEIKIVIDSYSQSDSLKSTNTELEKMITHLREVSKLQGGKAKNSNTVKDAAAAAAAVAKTAKEYDKLRIAIDKEILTEIKAANLRAAGYQKAAIAEQQLEQQKKRTALSALQLANAEKKAADQAERDAEKKKRQSDAYGQLSRRHAELKREAMNLAAAYGVESKQAQSAAAAANKLDVQLKKIDAKMGDHRRNVGNYASAWQGLNGVMGALGITLSAGAIFNGMKSAIVSFVEAEKNANALKFALKQVGGEGEIAFKKLIDQSEKLQESGGVFSDDEIQMAQTQLVNYGLLSTEVESLMPKILDLATAQGVDLATATDTVIKGINGQTKGLKTVGLGFEDTGSRADNYAIILDKLTKFEGAAANAATTTEGKYHVLMNRFDDLKEDIGEFLINEGARYLDYWDVLTGKLDIYTFAMKNQREATNKALDPITQKTIEDIMKVGEAGGRSKLENQIIAVDKAMNDLRATSVALSKDGLTVGDIGQKQGIADQLKALQELKDSLLSPVATPTFDDRTGDAGAKEEEKKKKAGKSAREIEYEKYKARVEGRKNLEHYESRVEYEDEQQRLSDIEARRKENEEIMEAQEELAFWQWQQEKELQGKLAEERKKAAEQTIEDAERAGDLVLQKLQEQSDKKLAIINKQISEQDKMVDIQRERAAQGLSNTLAFEEQKKAEMQRAAIAEQKKQEKLKKAEAYWELVAAFAKSQNNPADETAQRALRELAEATAISALFAEKGGMGEDLKETTNLVDGKFDRSHGSGDMLTMISPKEGILTEQNIQALGGKEGFYDLKYNLEKMGNSSINDDLFEKQGSSFMNVQLAKVAKVDTSKLEAKVDKLIDVIESKPVSSWNVDALGNYIHTLQKKGSTVITDKGSFVQPQRKKFIN